MKKTTILILAILIISGALFAAEYSFEPAFDWKSAEIMGQGSSYTANAAGYDSLFTNPAGFRVKNGDLNLITLQPNFQLNPFNFIEDMEGDGTGEPDVVSAILNQVTDNGLGAGFQTSIGYVGHGLGLGLAVNVDSEFPRAKTVFGARGDVWATAALIGGYSIQLNLLGAEWKIGADLRPMYRIRINDIDLNTVAGLMGEGDAGSTEPDFTSVDVLSGTGLAIDAGVQATWGMMTLGMSLRDIGGTRFTYDVSNLQAWMDGTQEVNKAFYNGPEYMTPMTLRLGAALHPHIPVLSFLIDPIVHAEYTHPLAEEDSYDSTYTMGTFWTRLDLGTEISIIKLLKLRAGYQGGYLTAGLGLDLFFLELNLAVYSREAGDYAGAQPVMGGTVDFSLRF